MENYKDYPGQLSLEEAKRLSILKWDAHVQSGGFCEHKDLPVAVQKLKSHCGFCQRWRIAETYPFQGCTLCELGKITGRCTEDESLWSQWADKSSIQNATSILLAIKTL